MSNIVTVNLDNLSENEKELILSITKKLREKESVLSLLRQGKQRWISVGDRMPDVDVFLGISRFNNRVRTYEVRKWDREWVVGGLNIKKDIKFWIPLPEPPKEG